MALENFHYAISLALQLYEVKADTEDMEEIGLIAYHFIGNKKTHLYRARLDIDSTGKAALPCNCDIIEAVTYCGPEDWLYTSNTKEFGDLYTSYVEDYIESNKVFKDPLYMSGKLVNYRLEGDYIYVHEGFGTINILYHGEILDEDGLPQLTMDEAIAIADYLGFIFLRKQARRTNSKLEFELAEQARRDWLIHCDAARVPEYVSLNDMDKILNASTSWNRKKRGYSYKPTQ